jgi:hypothetical protein
MHEVSMVPGNKLYEVEDDVFDLLQPAIDLTNGRFSRDSYATDILSGKSQLWIAFDPDTLKIEAAIITHVETYPHRTMLCWALCGGVNVDKWHHPMNDLLDNFRENMGCDGSEMVGRKGWSRFMKQHHGWSECFRFLEYMPDAEEKRNVA